MSSMTLGDGAAAFQLRQNNIRMRTDLNTLTQEMSSGKVKDLTAALGDTTVLRDVDRRLALAEQQGRTAAEIGQHMAAMQVHLDTVDVERRTLFDRLSTMTLDSTQQQLDTAVADATDAFHAVVNTLNGRFGGQYLFAGNATDTRPLAEAETTLTALQAVVAGANNSATAIARIEAWFDTPGGGFDTIGYLSPDTGPIIRKIDETTTAQINATAADDTLRDLLKASAIAALADAPGNGLSARDTATMIRDAATRLLSNAEPFNEFRATLGLTESRTQEASTQLTAQVTTLSVMRNTMDSADPFDTATRLQELQTQLETHYTVTARLARLSLAEYLR